MVSGMIDTGNFVERKGCMRRQSNPTQRSRRPCRRVLLGLLAALTLAVPAADIAMEAGDSRAANIALLGAFSTLSAAPLNGEDLERILTQRFQGKVLELNRKAFAMGREAAQKGGAV